jgi:hypothetical protein
VATYDVANSAGEDIHHLQLPVCSLPAIKEHSKTLIDDNESQIID